MFADYLGTLDAVERCTGLLGNCLGDKCLTSARRSEKKDSLGCADPHPLEDLGMVEREFDHLPDLLKFITQTSDVIVRDSSADRVALGLLRFIVDDHLGAGTYGYHSLWQCRCDEERCRFSQEQGGYEDLVTCHEGPALQTVMGLGYEVWVLETDELSLSDVGGENDLLRENDVPLVDPDLVPDLDSCRCPHESVDVDGIGPVSGRFVLEDLRRDGFLTNDLDDVSELETQRFA